LGTSAFGAALLRRCAEIVVQGLRVREPPKTVEGKIRNTKQGEEMRQTYHVMKRKNDLGQKQKRARTKESEKRKIKTEWNGRSIKNNHLTKTYTAKDRESHKRNEECQTGN